MISGRSITDKRQFLKHSLAAATFFVGKGSLTRALAGTANFTVGENGTPQKGWVASPSIVAKFEKRDEGKNFKVIYREENIPLYTLPDALVMNNGSKVTSA